MNMFNHSGLLFVLLSKWIITGCSQKPQIGLAPENEARLQSQSVKFQCSVNQDSKLDEAGYISWDECITKGLGSCNIISNDGTIVYNYTRNNDPIRGARYRSDTHVHPLRSQFDLIISGVLPEDGGQYKCHARNNPNARRFTELIVLNADPVCTRNTPKPNEALEGQYIKMTCTVKYKGRWAPVMTFQKNGADITAVDESSGNTVTYSYTLVVGPSNNGDVYAIRTYFSSPTDAGTDEATNRPSYENNFSFEPLTVWYSPKNITITPNETIFFHGETISCTATANPTASYDTRIKMIHSSNSSFHITGEMYGDVKFICLAYNEYGDVTAEKEFTISAGSSACDCKSYSLLIALGMLAAMLVEFLCQQQLSPTCQEMGGRQPVAPSVYEDIHKEYPEDQCPTTTPYTNEQDAGQQKLSPTYQEMGDRQPVAPSVYKDVHKQYPDDQVQSISPYANVHEAFPYQAIA